MRCLTVIGARPQFIKAAAVSRAFASRAITEILVHTGQHYDPGMSDVFFAELEIPAPAHHLGLGGGSHGQMTGRMLEGIERVMLDEKPDLLLVYGDTNSTLAGALAAAKLHIPVAHIEAGLRSIAFPAISTGIYGYPVAEAARIAVTAVREWLKENSGLEDVVFCCFSAGDLAEYRRRLGDESPAD